MAQGGRSFLSSLSKLWRSIFPNAASKPRFVGKDFEGNYYFEAEPVEGRHGGRRRRFVTPDPDSDPEATGLVVPNVPSEWEAWLRGRRKTPPTDEEQLKIAAMMAAKVARAKELDEKAALEREDLLAEGAIQPEVEKPEGVLGGAAGQFPLRQDMERYPGEGEGARAAMESEKARKKAEMEMKEKLQRVRKVHEEDK